MQDPKPVSVILPPDEHWLPTLKKVVTDFCQALDLAEPLVQRVVSSTEQACSELVAQSLKAEIDDQFVVKLSCRDEACVVELAYNKEVPLDPSKEKDTEAIELEDEHVGMSSLWLRHLMQQTDRMFFRYEADRRVLEMRIYRRSAGQVGRHWLMGLKARIKKDVKIDVYRDGEGNPVSSVLHDLESGKVLMMDAGGTFVVERLDGVNTFYDIYMDFIDKISLTSPELLVMIFTALESAGMLETQEEQKKARGVLGRLSSTINKVVFGSASLPDSEVVVDGLYERLSWLFSPFAIVFILLFALSGFIPLAREIDEFHHLISKPALAIYNNPAILIELYVSMILVTVFHELAHGLTCRHFGGSVHRMGIMFYLAMIIFFADVSAAWGFRSRWNRIAVSVAGPVLNLIIMSASFWIWHFQKGHVPAEHSIWFLLGFFCLYSTIINFIPFIKMDGYYILTDLTGISTLREKSFAYLGQNLFGFLRAGNSMGRIHPKGSEKWILLGYALFGVPFTALFLAYPFWELARYISAEHPSKAMIILCGVIVALTLYNAAYRAYQMAHSRLHREIVMA